MDFQKVGCSLGLLHLAFGHGDLLLGSPSLQGVQLGLGGLHGSLSPLVSSPSHVHLGVQFLGIPPNGQQVFQGGLSSVVGRLGHSHCLPTGGQLPGGQVPLVEDLFTLTLVERDPEAFAEGAEGGGYGDRESLGMGNKVSSPAQHVVLGLGGPGGRHGGLELVFGHFQLGSGGVNLGLEFLGVVADGQGILPCLIGSVASSLSLGQGGFGLTDGLGTGPSLDLGQSSLSDLDGGLGLSQLGLSQGLVEDDQGITFLHLVAFVGQELINAAWNFGGEGELLGLDKAGDTAHATGLGLTYHSKLVLELSECVGILAVIPVPAPDSAGNQQTQNKTPYFVFHGLPPKE